LGTERGAGGVNVVELPEGSQVVDEFGRYRDDVRAGVMGRHRLSISALPVRDIAGLSPPTPIVYSERISSMERWKDCQCLLLSTPPSLSAATGVSPVRSEEQRVGQDRR